MSREIEKLIDKSLRTEPKSFYSEGFADKVVGAIRKKETVRQRRLYFWIVLGCLAMFGFGFVILKVFVPNYIDANSLFDLGDQFNKAIPFAVILGIVIVAIQYLDQKLIKEKYLFS